MLDPDTYGIEKDGIIIASVPKICLKHAEKLVGTANSQPTNKSGVSE